MGAATLGDVLYARKPLDQVPEKDWAELVRAVAAGDQLALHALYERAHRVVFTLIVRITGNRETAEALTLDVFRDVWRRAARYDAANRTVLGWIMNQARSRAIEAAPDTLDALEIEEQGRALRGALPLLTPDERHAIETAYFSELTYAEVAVRSRVPLGTVKTRIRSGLHKLRRALDPKAARQ